MFVSSVCREQPLHRHTSMKRCVSTYQYVSNPLFSAEIIDCCLPSATILSKAMQPNLAKENMIDATINKVFIIYIPILRVDMRGWGLKDYRAYLL